MSKFEATTMSNLAKTASDRLGAQSQSQAPASRIIQPSSSRLSFVSAPKITSSQPMVPSIGGSASSGGGLGRPHQRNNNPTYGSHHTFGLGSPNATSTSSSSEIASSSSMSTSQQVGASGNSSGTNNSQSQQNRHQPIPLNLSHKMDFGGSHHQQQQQQYHQSPTILSNANFHAAANTSGLPTPSAPSNGLPLARSLTLRPRSSASNHNQSTDSPIPSTVGSALRRRQAPSPSTSLTAQPSSISGSKSSLLSTSSYSPGYMPQPSNSCNVYGRSQSQRPTICSLSSATTGSNSYKAPSVFSARPNTSIPSRFGLSPQKSQRPTINQTPGDQMNSCDSLSEQFADQDEEFQGSRCNESSLPPPTRSTNDFSRRTPASLTENFEPNSEPIVSLQHKQSPPQQVRKQSRPTPSRQTTSQTSNGSAITKPSQLVKPLISNSTQRQSSNIQTKQSSGLQKRASFSSQKPSTSTLQPNTRQVSNSTSRPSGVSMLPSISATNKSLKMPTNGSSSGNLSNSRRLSLQSATGYNSLNVTIRQQPKKATSGTTKSKDIQPNGDLEDDDEYEEDEAVEEEEVEDDDDNGQEEEISDEDDATTATSMTQMSDSQMTLSTANQELNNMIQMLSSSSILDDSEKRNNRKQINENDTGGMKTNDLQRNQTSSNLPSPAVPANLGSSRVLKSQSLRFNKKMSEKEHIEPPLKNRNLISTAPTAIPDSKSLNSSSYKSPSPSIYLSLNSNKNNSNNSNHRLLPRPRSRIIFNPTSSQFHVSCTTMTGDTTCCGDNSADSSDDSSGADLENLIKSRHQIKHQQEEDEMLESSMKLMDTQSKIITLKYLPQDNISTNGDSESKQDSDAIRRLKDCRGSLESLMTMNQSESSVDSRLQQQSPSKNQAKDRRSPVGFALRSFFGGGSGRQSAASNNRESSQPQTPQPQSTQPKVATIVRHASLRSDYRPFEVPHCPSLNRKSSHEQPQEQQNQTPILSSSPKTNLGGELLQLAGKKLSASSSSLASRFKFSFSSNSNQQNHPPDGSASSQKLRVSYLQFLPIVNNYMERTHG